MVINTDKAQTYAAAIAELKKEGKCPKETEHRQADRFMDVFSKATWRARLVRRTRNDQCRCRARSEPIGRGGCD